MFKKKKIAFYTILASGHFNVCSAIASTLLNLYPDGVEIYFCTDHTWAKKISKVDSRFKFQIFDYKEEKQEDFIKIMAEAMEPILSLSNIDKMKATYKSFFEDEGFAYVDQEVSKIFKKLKPDYLFCDVPAHMPAMIESKIPYSFVISCNPLLLNIDNLPMCGLDTGTNEKEKIKEIREKLEVIYEEINNHLDSIYKKRNVVYDKKHKASVIKSENLSIYCYPKELDYFDDNIRNDYKLLQIDSPIVPSRVPTPYSLPEEFSNLPGKIIYVSLGSVFSCYYTKLQKLLDTLATLPYKYIVSKGPNGDKIKFPNDRFIGENFINQLAVLQVVDMMIAHGGNNTFTECFHFGVPALIFPMIGDQINNAVRIEETGFGYKMDLMNYTQEELSDKINKVLSNETLIEKTKKVGERIRNENSLEKTVQKFYNYLMQVTN